MAKTDTKTVPSGVKVSDLAKQLKLKSKDLIAKADEMNIKVKSASSYFTVGQADRLKAKLGSSDTLRIELEKKKTTVIAKAATGRVRTGRAPAKPARSIPETVEVAEPAPSETEATDEPAEAFEPVVEPVPPPAEPVPAAEPVADLPPAVEPLPAQPAEASEAPVEATLIKAGPDLPPPVRRQDDASTSSDTRFGVVISAEEAKKIHGEVESGRKKKGPTEVKAKEVAEFQPQVSYPTLPPMTEEEDSRGRRGGLPGRSGPARRGPQRGPQRGPRRGRGLMQQDDRYRKLRRGGRARSAQQTVVRTGPAEVTAPVTIKNLCEALGIKAADLIKKFFTEGKVVKINDILTDDEAMLYASEFDPLKFGIKIKKARDVEEEMLSKAEEPDKPEDLLPRSPVITIMGHVDHGKTSLLDYIRKANVAAGEAGGITQHIRAYKVHRPGGDLVFLDTPGHRAFTEMRARGANVTDLVVLVVAANDGVMPQTEEAISHAKAAGKPMVVAINKCDLPDANAEKVKMQLSAKEVFLENYGGNVGFVEVSAKTGDRVNDLLDRILLEAEVLELKSNPNKHAIGTVVEAHKDPGRGIEATLLVQEGTLSVGDVIIAGHAYGTVRQVLNDRGETIDEAGPSTPVLLTGLNEVPLAGERFHVLESIKQAADIAQKRAMLMRQEGLTHRHHVSLENLHDMLAQGEVASLRVILKVDVMGSLTPVQNAILELSTSEANIEVIHAAVGAVNETDVTLADASDAIVIGFNVSVDPGARKHAEERGVDVRTYEIIYEVVDEMRKALEGILKPIEQESIQSHLEVRQTFKISKIGTIAGCFVTDGTVHRNHQIRLIRDGKPVWQGKLASLKRVKDDVREVREGFECGLKLDGYDDIKQGDTLESFTVEQVARTLDGAERK